MAVQRGYVSEREHVGDVVAILDGDTLMRLEPKLAPEVFAAICTWDNLTGFLKLLAWKGTSPHDDRLRGQLVALMAKQLERNMATEACPELHDKLSLLEDRMCRR